MCAQWCDLLKKFEPSHVANRNFSSDWTSWITLLLKPKCILRVHAPNFGWGCLVTRLVLCVLHPTWRCTSSMKMLCDEDVMWWSDVRRTLFTSNGYYSCVTTCNLQAFANRFASFRQLRCEVSDSLLELLEVIADCLIASGGLKILIVCELQIVIAREHRKPSNFMCEVFQLWLANWPMSNNIVWKSDCQPPT